MILNRIINMIVRECKDTVNNSYIWGLYSMIINNIIYVHIGATSNEYPEQTKLDLLTSVYTSISWKQKPINQNSNQN